MHPSVCARTISCSRSKRLGLAWCRPERPTLDQRLRRPLLLGRLQQLDGKAENGGGRPSAALATRHGGFENIYVPSGENRLPCTLPQAHHRSTTTTRTHPVLRTSALDALTHVSLSYRLQEETAVRTCSERTRRLGETEKPALGHSGSRGDATRVEATGEEGEVSAGAEGEVCSSFAVCRDGCAPDRLARRRCNCAHDEYAPST